VSILIVRMDLKKRHKDKSIALADLNFINNIGFGFFPTPEADP